MNDKFTMRGYGASGAASSGWNQPRESYKAPVDHGTSFLPGNGGARARPGAERSSSQDSHMIDGGGASVRHKDDSAQTLSRWAAPSRVISDIRGGDDTTTRLERRGMFVILLVGALIFSGIAKACAGGSEQSNWVDERRSLSRPSDS